jgi:hypothetical protein
MELKRENIIKALECCNSEGHICGKCPYESVRIGISCRDKLIRDALALIKELTEENERLRAIPEQLHKEMSERMVEEVKTAKKYTVLIMQSEINKTLSALCKGDVSEIHRIIDQIAKEMLEGSK